ncbi:MAG: ComF family protein [Gammaproteobacteria bacterium]
MQGLLSNYSRLVFPPRCTLCQRPGINRLDICRHCYNALPFIMHACSQCALPLETSTAVGGKCGQCLQSPPAFDAAFSLLRYQDLAAQLITRYKFHDKLSYSGLLADLLLERLPHIARPDCIIAVPLHVARLRERGFNQSHELAKIISPRLGIPLASDSVVRIRETQQQTGLNAKQRRKNIRGAFELVKPVAHNHVALLDDVVTTGSTVNELARVLKRAGVKAVSVWSIARAV